MGGTFTREELNAQIEKWQRENQERIEQELQAKKNASDEAARKVAAHVHALLKPQMDKINANFQEIFAEIAELKKQKPEDMNEEQLIALVHKILDNHSLAMEHVLTLQDKWDSNLHKARFKERMKERESYKYAQYANEDEPPHPGGRDF